MGFICSKPMEVGNNFSESRSLSVTAYGPMSTSLAVEKIIMKIDQHKIIMENKMKILSDKVDEFTNVSLKPTIKEIGDSKKITKDQKVTKKQFLDALLDRCDMLYQDIANMLQLKKDLENDFINLDLNLIEDNKDINKEIENYEKGFGELKKVYTKNDRAFKDIFYDFMSIRTYWDMIEEYEEDIHIIQKDVDVMNKAIINLFQDITDSNEFVEQHMINNINYDDIVARNILRIIQDSRMKFVGMAIIFSTIQKKFSCILQTYKDQKDKKFNDQDVIMEDTSQMKELKNLKNKCRESFKKIRLVVKDIRKQLGDMYVDKLTDQMEEKIQDLNQEIQDKLVKKKLDITLNQTYITNQMDEPEIKSPIISPKATQRLDQEQDEENTLTMAQQLKDEIQDLKMEIESRSSDILKKCELKVLGQMIEKQKQVTLQLLRLENETALKIIDAALKKIDDKSSELREFIEQYSKISPNQKLKDKNQQQLKQQQYTQGLKELIGFNLYSQSYKNRLQQVMDDTNDMIELQQLTLRIPELRKIKDSVISLKIEIKQKYKELGTGKKKQSRQSSKYKDLSDKLMQNFISKQKPDFSIERVTLNIYVFGDQKIVTKIHNGVLCVREDAGLIPIDKFYNDILNKQLQKQRGYSSSFKITKEQTLSPKVQMNQNDRSNVSSKMGYTKTQSTFTSPVYSPKNNKIYAQSFTFEQDNKFRIASMKTTPKNQPTNKISIKKIGFAEQQYRERLKTQVDKKNQLISQKYTSLDKTVKNQLMDSPNPRSEGSFQVDFDQSIISKGDVINEQTIAIQDESYDSSSDQSDQLQQSGQIMNTF